MGAWLITSGIGRWLGAFLAALATLAAAWFAGRSSRSVDVERERFKRYRETMGKMDHADIGTGDGAADREWLRERAKHRSGL